MNQEQVVINRRVMEAIIVRLPAPDRQQITDVQIHLRALIERHGEAGIIALSLVSADLVAGR